METFFVQIESKDWVVQVEARISTRIVLQHRKAILGVFMSYCLPLKPFYLSLSSLGCPGYCRRRRAIRTGQPELGLRDTGKKNKKQEGRSRKVGSFFPVSHKPS